MLVLTDEHGAASPVNGFQLGALFASYPEIRLALLNSCEGARTGRADPFSGVAAALVERGIPAVIGMQFEISDAAAITFSEEFYAALVDGLPIDAALTEARRAVFFLPNWVEFATPVLFMRSPNGVLFNIQGKALTPPPSQGKGVEATLPEGEGWRLSEAQTGDEGDEPSERERLAVEQAERERLEASKAEQERLAAEKAGQDRVAAEKAERERLAAEKAEQDRVVAEKAERERLEAEHAMQERLAAKQAEHGLSGEKPATTRRSTFVRLLQPI